eukprot:XP_011425625.1 PREDICTED: uncharacterized protein LOC105327036 isoform X1 [Crassostrea gigas]
MEPLRAAIFLFLFAAFIAEQSSSLSVHHITKRDTSESDGSSTTGDDQGDDGQSRDDMDASNGGSQTSQSDDSGGSVNIDMAEMRGSDGDSGDGNRDDSSEGKNCNKCKNKQGTTGDDSYEGATVLMGADTGSSDSGVGIGSDDFSDRTVGIIGIETGSSNSGSSDSGAGVGSDDSNERAIDGMQFGTGGDDSSDGVIDDMRLGTRTIDLGSATGSDDSNSGTGSDDSSEGEIDGSRDRILDFNNMETGSDDSNSRTGSDDSSEGEMDGSGGKRKCSRCAKKTNMADSGAEGDDSEEGTTRDEILNFNNMETGSDSGEGTGSSDSGEGTDRQGDLTYGAQVGTVGSGATSNSDSSEGDAGYNNGDITDSDSKENLGDDSQEMGSQTGGSDSSGQDSNEIQAATILDNEYPRNSERLTSDLLLSESTGGEINRFNIDNTNGPAEGPSKWPNVPVGDIFMESNNNLPLPGDSTWRDPGVPTPTGGYPGNRDSAFPGDQVQFIPEVPTTPEPTFVKSNVPPGMESIRVEAAPLIDPTEASYIQPPAIPSPTPTPYYEGNQYEQNYNQGPDTMTLTQGYEKINGPSATEMNYPTESYTNEMNQNIPPQPDIVPPIQDYGTNEFTPNVPSVPGTMDPTPGYGPNKFEQNAPTGVVSTVMGEQEGVGTIMDQTSLNLGPVVDSGNFVNPPPSSGGFVDLSIRGKGHLMDGSPAGVDGVAVGNYIKGPNDMKVWSDSTQPATTGVIELFHKSGKMHGLKKICVHIRQGPADAATTAVQTGQQNGGLKTFLKSILQDGVVTSERVVGQQGDATGKMNINIPDGSIDIGRNIENQIGAGMVDNQMNAQNMDLRINRMPQPFINEPGAGMVDNQMNAQNMDLRINRMPQSFINEPREIRFTNNALKRRPSKIFLAISSKLKEADHARPLDFNPAAERGQVQAHSQNGKGVIRVYTKQSDGTKSMKRVFVNIRQPEPYVRTSAVTRTVKIPMTRMYNTGSDGAVTIGFGGGSSPGVTGARTGLTGSVSGTMMRVDGGHVHSDIGHAHDGHGHIHMGHAHDGHSHDGHGHSHGHAVHTMRVDGDPSVRSVSGQMFKVDGRSIFPELGADQTVRSGSQQMNEVTLPNGNFHVHKIGDRNIVHDHRHGNVDQDTYKRVMELLGRRLPAIDSNFDPYVTSTSNMHRPSTKGIPVNI